MGQSSMTQVQQIKSLAAALAVAQKDAGDNLGSRALIDELAQALARSEPQRPAGPGSLASALAAPRPMPGAPKSTLMVSPDAADFDDDDDVADLPMLVQGPKPLALDPRPSPVGGGEGRAALYGFGAGLTVLIPLGIMWSLRTGDVVDTQSGATAASLAPNIVRTESIPLTTASISRPAVRIENEVRDASGSGVSGTAPAPYAEALLEAEGLIARGNIEAARHALHEAARADVPKALVALAETYDPNMLAAWSARNVSADAGIARALYGRALISGDVKAKQRLEALE